MWYHLNIYNKHMFLLFLKIHRFCPHYYIHTTCHAFCILRQMSMYYLFWKMYIFTGYFFSVVESVFSDQFQKQNALKLPFSLLSFIDLSKKIWNKPQIGQRGKLIKNNSTSYFSLESKIMLIYQRFSTFFQTCKCATLFSSSHKSVIEES